MVTKFFYFLSLCFLMIFFSFQLKASEQIQAKAFVFDFGGVFAKSDHAQIADFISKTFQISQIEAVEALAKLKEFCTNGDNEELFWNNYAQEKATNLPTNWFEQLNEVKFLSLKIIPGMVDVVKDLQKQGYQTALLSNVRKSQAQIKGKLGYYELFNPIVFSYEIGVSKPDPKAFQIMLERLNLSPEEVIFVDNKSHNVETAKKLRIDAILFVHTAQFIADLKERGIEVSELKS